MKGVRVQRMGPVGVGYCWNPSIQSPVRASDVLVLTTSVSLEMHCTSTYMYVD